MRITSRLSILTFGLLAFASIHAQQSLTSEQIELLRSLPEAQQQQLIKQYARPGIDQRDTELDFPALFTVRPDAEAVEPDPVITGGETLVIGFSIRADVTVETQRQFRLDANRVALLGSNVYVLNDAGTLRLPGVATMSLRGLDVENITLRLDAEPALRELSASVAILPLAPSGVASLKRFGSELFDAVPTTFAPATDIPVPADYVVGPGDWIKLQLFGNENAEYDLVIGRDGTVNVPEIGPVGTAGLNFSQLRDELVQRIAEQKIGVRASVTIGELRAIRVFVLGDARTPGSFTVSGLSTITNALFVSGGISDAGSMRDVQLKRSGKIVARLDLYDLLLRGDTSGDLRLQPGDVIFVPPIGATVAVSGQVVRSAIYETRGGGSIQDILTMAGGLLPTAHRSSGQLERIDAAGHRKVLSLNLADKTDLALAVHSGDSLYVDQVLDALEDTVLLDGHVLRPGPYQWEPGTRLTDVIKSPLALQSHADLGYVLVRREIATSGEVEVLSADIASAWRAPGSEEDLLLQARDRLTVFELGPSRGIAVSTLLEDLNAQSRFNAPFREISVSGQVQAAGTYPMEVGMRLSDLIRAGGGLTESAFVERAELTRYEIGADGQRHSMLLEVDLAKAMRGDPGHDAVLMAHDHLNVREVPLWRDKESVSLRGEVRFPGTYTIQREETLRSVIARAGGLTQRAFPEGAVLTRVALRERERHQLQVLADRLESDLAVLALRASNDPAGETQQALSVGQSLLVQLRSTEPVGRLVIDLAALQGVASQESSELLLRDGDVLLVPEQTQEVTVIGEVQYPTSHMYQSSWHRDDYIESSGGMTAKADGRRIYVVRVDGSVDVESGSSFFRRDKGIDIRPGDTIVVPLDAESMSPVAFWRNVTQVVFNLAVAVAAINSF